MSRKSKDNIEALVLAALDMLDCDDLTTDQSMKADEIYQSASELEDMLENPEPEDEEG